MQPAHSRIDIPGLRRTLRLFHLTDMHLTEALASDTEYVRRLTVERRRVFRPQEAAPTEATYRALLVQAQALGADCVVMTGDILDCPSEGNLALLRETVGDAFYVVGNHDWCDPVNYPMKEPIRQKYQTLIRQATGQPPRMQARELEDVLLVGIDNSNYQVDDEQAAFVERQLGRGRPTLLLMHIPLYCPTLVEDTVRVWTSPILMGAPAERFPDAGVFGESIFPTPVTRDFCAFLRQASNLAAILAGHVHFHHEDLFAPGKPQLVTAAAATDPVPARIVELAPA